MFISHNIRRINPASQVYNFLALTGQGEVMGKSKAAADGKHDALYLRVSGRGQDTASQEPDLKRWADSQDGPFVWYRDKFTV